MRLIGARPGEGICARICETSRYGLLDVACENQNGLDGRMKSCVRNRDMGNVRRGGCSYCILRPGGTMKAARSLACAAPALTSPLRNFFPGGFERFQHSEKCRNLFVASDAAELSLRDE